MAVIQQLADTRAAFDSVAADYHRTNVENRLLAAMRERTMAAVHRWVPRGAHLLDLGCGPGTDTVRLAAEGYRVTAIDPSPSMVAEARRRIAAAGVGHRADAHLLGAQDLDRLAPGAFDAACADLGPLNCVPDLAQAACGLARALRPGGLLVTSVIGRVCPWEILRYTLDADWTRVRVRFASEVVPVPLNGRRIWTRYYSPREFERVMAPAGFARVWLRTLGLLTPPPYLDGFARRHARLVNALERIEDAVGAWPGVRAWGDHFLVVLRRNPDVSHE